jgi:FkbM family methyltransferase
VPAVNAWAARLRAAWIRRVLRRSRIPFRDRYGVHYVLRSTDDLQLYFRHRGWFEEGEQAFCARHLGPGMIAFDVGAYLGVYTLQMARLVGAAGHVHAFEPSPDSHARLLEHVRLNDVANVTTQRCAVHATTGRMTLTLYGPPFESLATLGRAEIVRGGTPLPPLAAVATDTVALDDYCARASIEGIDLLKLDVEGAELAVLQGAAGLLSRGAIRCVLVEVGAGMEAVRALLERAHLGFWSIARDGTLRPLEGAPTGARNVVALHRRSSPPG